MAGWCELSSFYLCLSLQPWAPSSPTQAGILLKTQRMTHDEELVLRNGDKDGLGSPGQSIGPR